MACGRVVEAMTRNEGAVFPLGTHLPEYGVTLAMPTVTGRGGVARVLRPSMSTEERDAPELGAETMHKVLAPLL